MAKSTPSALTAFRQPLQTSPNCRRAPVPRVVWGVAAMLLLLALWWLAR